MKTQGKRLREHMEELGKIGAAPEGGVNRFTYSKEYYESVELVRRYMEDAGLETEVDPVGNVIGTCVGILIGSFCWVPILTVCPMPEFLMGV